MRQPIRGIPSDEKVDIARRLLASAVTAHDLDPNFRVDAVCFIPHGIEDLFALFAWDPRFQIFVELYADLTSMRMVM